MSKNKHLTRKLFDRAIKEIEKDAEWGVRHPRIEVWHPKDLEKLKKAGLYREFFNRRSKE